MVNIDVSFSPQGTKAPRKNKAQGYHRTPKDFDDLNKNGVLGAFVA